jgi:hypothetical protein
MDRTGSVAVEATITPLVELVNTRVTVVEPVGLGSAPGWLPQPMDIT